MNTKQLWVLTAAHCYVDEESLGPEASFYVFAGTVYLNGTNSNGTRRYISRTVKVHSDYNDTYAANDIAVIKVTKPFAYNQFIQPIKLASTKNLPKPGSYATVAGWGWTSPNYSSSAEPNLLQVLSVEYISLANCKKYNPIDPNWPLELARDSNVCTFIEAGQDSCEGDSGSPLVYNNYQIGVVSFGANPCASGKPCIYASVPYFESWISKETGIGFT